MAKSKAARKQFKLSRSPYWIDPEHSYSSRSRAPEPDLAVKVVEVTSVADLVAQATAFGNEWHGA